jgi:hypothetical protein
MLKPEAQAILHESAAAGWVLEPEAKRLLNLYGFDVPQFTWARSSTEACSQAGQIGFPVVAKVVSTAVVHKSDVDGVAVGLADEQAVASTFERFSQLPDFDGMLVEEMVDGIELIVGGKNDYQFGPVMLVGIGGTSVELYGDTVIRMAPLQAEDIAPMLSCLKAHELLQGFRGLAPINLERLSSTLLAFSELLMDLDDQFSSLDLNPVMCSPQRCVVADARIILSDKLND